MRSEWLNCLKKVVECGSMGKAAKALFCSQPTVSNAIKSIEDELGAPVLNRTSDGLTLTHLGELVLQDSTYILNYLESWKHLAKNESTRHPIHIALSSTSPSHYLLTNVLKIKKEDPTFDVSLEYTMHGESSLDLLKKDPFPRFGVFYRNPDSIPKSLELVRENGMRMALLNRDEFGLFCNSKNPLAQLNREITREDIRGHHVLLYQDPMDFPYLRELQMLDCNFGPPMYWEGNIMLVLAQDENSISFRPKSTVNHQTSI